jgi:hypothetical protein
MSYLALYRKFRPQTFDEIVGQDFVVTTLKNQIKSGNISHAYLFTGGARERRLPQRSFRAQSTVLTPLTATPA